MTRNWSVPFGLLALGTLLPLTASAQATSISEVIGLFNILTGFMFVISFTLFVGGIISYMVDFGNLERLKGIQLMEWSVAILFVLVVFLGAAQFLQGNRGLTNIIAAGIVVLALLYVIITSLAAEPAKPEKKEGPKT